MEAGQPGGWWSDRSWSRGFVGYWILSHSFNKHLNTHTCLVLDGMGKWLAVRGTWDRAVRGESGRAALRGIAKGLH